MTNYLYPNLGGTGGGGGGVTDVTASVPLFSSGGATPNITITQNFYDVGTSWPYATIAAAIAAAVGAGDTTATIRINQNITEDVTLPRGMTLTGQAPPGNSSRSLTGRIQSGFATGISNVTGLVLIGNGTQEIFNSSAAGNFWFTNCTFAQASDFPIGVLSAGGTAALSNCNIIGAGIATAYAFTNLGTLSLRNCSGLTIPSGLFLNQGSGGFTVDGAIISGSLNITNGATNLKYTNVGVTALYGLNLTSGTAAVIQDCNFSSTSGDNVIQGTGTINYKNLGFTNTQKGIDATITLTPYATAINAIAAQDAKFALTAGNYEYGIESATNTFAFNAPPSTGFKFYVNAAQTLYLNNYGYRLTTDASVGATIPAVTVEVSGNVNLPEVESPNARYNFSQTQQFVGGGGVPIPVQREFLIEAPTYSSGGGLTSITLAATHGLTGPPDQGSNMTINGSIGYYCGGRNLSSGSSLGFVAIPSGITNGIGNTGIHTGFAVLSSGSVAMGNQVATTSFATSVYLPSIQWSAVTNTRTLTNLATVYVGGAPTTSGTIGVTNGPYAVFVDSGTVRIDGRLNLGRFTGTPSAASQTIPEDGWGGTLTGNTDIDYIDTTGWTPWSWTVVNFTGTPTINHNTGAVPGGYASILCNGSANMGPLTSGTYVMLMYNGTNFIASYWYQP